VSVTGTQIYLTIVSRATVGDSLLSQSKRKAWAISKLSCFLTLIKAEYAR